jgi:hypothetical protein
MLLAVVDFGGSDDLVSPDEWVQGLGSDPTQPRAALRPR